MNYIDQAKTWFLWAIFHKIEAEIDKRIGLSGSMHTEAAIYCLAQGLAALVLAEAPYAPGYRTPPGLPRAVFIGSTENGEQYKP